MTRIAFLGDTHGNYGFIEAFYRHLEEKELDVDIVFQVGDFGYWEHRGGKPFLDRTSKLATDTDIPFYWIDGNHENFEYLYKKYVQDEWDEFVPIRDNLIYVPRGKTWEWDGVKFMGFGGAYSVDKSRRVNMIDWWKEEMPTQEEADRAALNGKVDVLISHDVPHFSNLSAMMDLVEIAGARESRDILDIVAKNCEPRVIVHGHYHYPFTNTVEMDWGKVTLYALDCDQAARWGDVFTILDTGRISYD